jgi:hypothetical protein
MVVVSGQRDAMHLPAHYSRRLVGVAAVACAAALIPVAALAAPTARSAPVATRTLSCTTSGLVIWLNVPPGNQGAGHAYYYLEFTNLSGHACTLRGYPRVSAVSLAGRQLGSPAAIDSYRTSLVRLASGATATAELEITEPGVIGAACGPVLSAGLRVYPPHQARAKVIPYPFPACSHTGPAWIVTEAVSKG